MKCARKWFGSLLVLCCIAFGAMPVEAYVSEGPCVDTNNSNIKVSTFINSSNTDYKFEGANEDREVELERKFIGISLTKAIGSRMDMYGAAGYMFDGSLNWETIEGDIGLDNGYFLSAGARYMVFQSGNFSAHIFGQFDYILEEKFSAPIILNINGFDIELDSDFELDGYEVLLGGAINYKINDKFSTYAGLSFVPLADLTYDIELSSMDRTIFNQDGDVERDDDLGFKAGASYLINNQWSVRGEANFASDQAYMVSVGMQF
jgi:hypothetical protein